MPDIQAIRMKLVRAMRRVGFRPDWYLIPLAAVIGSLAGLVALGFGRMVEGAQWLFYDKLAGAKVLTSHYLWVVVALPALGGLLVGLIKVGFRLPLISHGIPDVMESLARKRGRMKVRSGFFTAINSALTIGSGGSAGQEGPIIHIGSVLGSTVGKVLRVNQQHMGTLVGCGAAGGLAAIFNAPIAGVVLVLEVMLRDFSLKTFMPVVVATVFSVAVFQATAGQNQALFTVTSEMQAYQFHLSEFLPYLLLGVACGVMGWAFTKLLFSMETLWDRWKKYTFMRPAMGGLCVGLMGLLFMYMFPKHVGDYKLPAFFANGYPIVETLLNPGSYGGLTHTALVTFGFLAIAAICKLLATSLSLGSGGSGGIFAPSLFMGAAVGGAFGVLLAHTGLIEPISPATYALAGMAGVLSGAVHCPMTAFILVFEITRDYKVILPVMLVAITATVVAQLLLSDSIYTLALREMGLRVGLISEVAVLRRLIVGDVPLVEAVVVHPGDALESLLEIAEDRQIEDFLVCDTDERYVGMVTDDDLRIALLQREAVPLLIVAEMMRTDLPTIQPDESLDLVLDKFADCDVNALPVIQSETGKLLGLITRSRLMGYYHHALSQPG